ncbi:MAG TPA: glycosyltransferase [bacterium]|nr:glycosyltransferase [bacterium]
MLRKILYITYHFPPSTKVGAIRAKGFARYMPCFGWHVIVLSPLLSGKPDGQFHIVETHPPYQKIPPYLFNPNLRKRLKSAVGYLPPIHQRIYSFFRGAIDVPDSRIGWLPFAVYAAETIIKEEKPQVIVSNFGPASCHIVASQLKKSHPEIFWLADFRDPWTQFRKNSLRTRFEKSLEHKTLKYADALSIVSQYLANALQKDYPDKKVYTIPNGFDPAEMVIDNNPVTDKFVISHTGSLNRKFRNPSILLQALQNLIKTGKIERQHIMVTFYGHDQSWVLKDACKYGIADIVSYQGAKDRKEILEIQRNSQALLLIWRSGKGEEVTLTGKIFEYLASGRPIISIGENAGEIEYLLQQTHAGIHCKTLSETQAILCKMYQQWLKNHSVEYQGVKQEITKYSHIEMARRFSQALENG